MDALEHNQVKNYFDKIKINIIYNILYFLDFFSIAEISFLNNFFYIMMKKRFTKRTKMITTSLKVYKKKLNFDFAQDFHHILSNNSQLISKEIKPIIMNMLQVDYFYKLPVLKHYFNKIRIKNFSKISLVNTNLGQKSIKYLSYYIENNLNIKKLNLSKNKLTENILSPLSKTIQSALNLFSLKLNYCVTDNTTYKNLNKIISINPRLTHLSLAFCNLEDEGLILLESLENIISLNLAGNKISTIGLKHILETSSSLQILNLENNHLNSISGLYLSLFLKNPECKLKKIFMGDNYITNSGLRSIFFALTFNPRSQLEVLSIDQNILENFEIELFGEIKMNSLCCLKRLDFGKYNLNQEIFEKILNFLNKFKSINCINFCDNSCFIKESNIDLFFKEFLFKTKANIKSLVLDNCYIGMGKFLKYLLDYYKFDENSISVTELSLASNSLYLLNTNLLTEIFYQNKLKILNLSDNELNLWTEDKFKKLSIAVGKNEYLEYLNLNNNKLGSYVCYLFEFLKFNSCLKELHLDCNKLIIDESLIDCLKNLLDFNKCLQILSMSKNNLSDPFVISIFENIINNYSILKFDLSMNDITINCVFKIIIHILQKGNSIKNSLFEKKIILKNELIDSAFANSEVSELRKNVDLFKTLII